MRKCIKVEKILFCGRQNIAWSDVEQYLRRFTGQSIVNMKYGDRIQINFSFADEYVHSQYTRNLRGGLAKVKANIVQAIPELVENAVNRRWIENKNEKHKNNAIRGWYRYEVYFMMVTNREGEKNFNSYSATLIVRSNDTGLYLYDIVNIKKEARKPMDS